MLKKKRLLFRRKFLSQTIHSKENDEKFGEQITKFKKGENRQKPPSIRMKKNLRKNKVKRKIKQPKLGCPSDNRYNVHVLQVCIDWFMCRNNKKTAQKC